MLSKQTCETGTAVPGPRLSRPWPKHECAAQRAPRSSAARALIGPPPSRLLQLRPHEAQRRAARAEAALPLSMPVRLPILHLQTHCTVTWFQRACGKGASRFASASTGIQEMVFLSSIQLRRGSRAFARHSPPTVYSTRDPA